MSYKITVRLFQRDPSNFFDVAECGILAGGTWSTYNSQHIVQFVGNGSSGTLRFVSDTNENFLLALGIHNDKRWCDIVTDLDNDQTGVTINPQYYTGNRGGQREKQLEAYSVKNRQGRNFSVKFTRAEGHDLACSVIIDAIPVAPTPSIASPPSLSVGSWIWTTEAQTNPQPGVGHTRAFRRTLIMPSPVNALTIDASADEFFTIFVNGKDVGCSMEWRQPYRFTVKFEETSTVVVSAVVTQHTANRDVGFISCFKVWNTKDINPVGVECGTDSRWVTLLTDKFPDEFISPSFNDAFWVPAYVRCAYGAAPWSDIGPVKAAAGVQHVGGKIHNFDGTRDAPTAPAADHWDI